MPKMAEEHIKEAKRLCTYLNKIKILKDNKVLCNVDLNNLRRVIIHIPLPFDSYYTAIISVSKSTSINIFKYKIQMVNIYNEYEEQKNMEQRYFTKRHDVSIHILNLIDIPTALFRSTNKNKFEVIDKSSEFIDERKVENYLLNI